MKLSTRSRYGTRTMLEFAKNWGQGPTSLTEAASNQQVSLKYLEHIVAALKGAGLLNASRGRRGGYELSRPPEKIRLDEVVAAAHCQRAAGAGGLDRNGDSAVHRSRL